MELVRDWCNGGMEMWCTVYSAGCDGMKWDGTV